MRKHSGKVAWSSNLPGNNIMHAQWSSPTRADVDNRPQVIFPGGDGWLYAFEPKSGKLLWKFDCNPKDAVWRIGGLGTKSNFIAPAVVHNKHLYVGVGQDPEHNTGVGHLWCVNLELATASARRNAARDVSPTLLGKLIPGGGGQRRIVNNPDTALHWHFGGMARPGEKTATGEDYHFGRTMSLCAIKDNLLYVTDLSGHVYCLDARTGKLQWTHSTFSLTWAGPFVVDNKVYVGNDDGTIYVFRHGAKKSELAEIIMGRAAKIRVSPVAANGRLYVVTENPTKLYAIEFGTK